MANIKFNVNGVIVGKQFKGATEKFVTLQGKEIAAQPDRYYLVCAFGEMTENEELFVGLPAVRLVRTTKEDYDKLTDFEASIFKVDMVDSLDNYKTKIIEASNFEVLA